MAAAFRIDRYLNVRSATGPTFSPDARFVAFLTNTTGVAQLWQVPVEGGEPAQLTFAGFSHDGERIAFAANRDDAGRFDVFVQKIGDKDARLVEKGPGGYYQPLAFSPDDRSLLVYRSESNFNQDLFVLDVAAGKSRK